MSWDFVLTCCQNNQVYFQNPLGIRVFLKNTNNLMSYYFYIEPRAGRLPEQEFLPKKVLEQVKIITR